ncbi:MAG: hypothetical protein ACLQFR_01915 [Streptosporangiaceae bacterium]
MDSTSLEDMDGGSQAGALDLMGLRRRYGDVVALDGLSLFVPRGQVFGFLGPNGAGKPPGDACHRRRRLPRSVNPLFHVLAVIRSPPR